MPENRSDLIDRLAAHRIVGAIPREEIEWLADHGQLRRLEPGQVLTSRNIGVVEGLFIVLSGQIGLHVERANGREKIAEWHAGDITGVLPYSRLTRPPGDTSAELPTDVVLIPRDELQDLIRECHAFTTDLVHLMLDRTRFFTSSDLRAEKMASLGKLSAGLAHELNNPAAAIVRSARSLPDALTSNENASRALGALSFTAEQLAALDAVRSQAMQTDAHVVRSPLEQADREAEIEDWLAQTGANLDCAAPLAETGITLSMLGELQSSFDATQLPAALRWLAAGCATRQLADEIGVAASRISSLVDAVKGFTRMDLNPTAGPVDVAQGLAQTLAIHGSKARAKSASVRVNVAPALPPAHGFAGELNQVWANLLDNALDAIATGGAVDITATTEGQRLIVRFTDDGPGIPADIKGRIFDPFFTTKKVGEGTGLGLDIVKRIVEKHQGAVTVESRPGRTEFTVSLPLTAQENR